MSQNTPYFRISVWCQLLLLATVISILDTATATGGLSSDRVASSNDYCRKHKLWMSCCQDPCSRTGDHNSPKACVYCTETEVCQAAENISQVCSRHNAIEVTEKRCPIVAPKSKRCIVETDDFYIDLTAMDFVIVTDENGNKLTVGICRDVFITKGTTLYDCCGTCVAPVFLCNASDIESTCWALGSLAAMNISVISKTNPRKGVVIQYGTTDCCPHGLDKAPGVTGSLYVRIIILPSDDLDKTSKHGYTAHINNFPSSVGLTDCSNAVHESFEVTLELSNFFSYVIYKLSTFASNLTCSTLNGGTVKCQLFPVLSVNGTLAASGVCRRLEVALYYDTGKTVRRNMNQLHHFSGPCSFELAIDSNVSAIGVTDPSVDNYPIGGLYNITLNSVIYGNSRLVVYILIAGGGAILIALISTILLGVKCYIKRKKLSNQEEDDGQTIIEDTDNNDEPSCTAPLLASQKAYTAVKEESDELVSKTINDELTVEMLDTVNDLRDEFEKKVAEGKIN